MMRARAFAAVVFLFAAFSPARSEVPAPRVLVASYSGIITPVASEFMRGAVKRAEDEGFDAVVLQLDTPGGLDLSMREIVKSILGARVPVIVYVHPTGGRAASAGVFITMAAHVAAMTPGTNIGAAHPVVLPMMGGKSGKPDAVMGAKMVNDAAAYLKSIARKRGRNEEWAFEAVSKSTSIPAGEAVALGVVDIVAPDLPTLLRKIDGRRLSDFKQPLKTKGAVTVRMEMTRRQRWLAAISNPNVAMILMSLGAGGLFIELYNPGLILPGVVGTICLILAFYAFETLSASYAGISLFFIGIFFFVLEVKVVSFGLLALGGAIAMFLGALILFDQPMGGLSVSWSVIGSSIGGLLVITTVVSTIAYRAYKRKSITGMEGMAGETGKAEEALNPGGQVSVHGELWEAESVEGRIRKGDKIVVVSCEGLRLKVRKKPPS